MPEQMKKCANCGKNYSVTPKEQRELGGKQQLMLMYCPACRPAATANLSAGKTVPNGQRQSPKPSYQSRLTPPSSSSATESAPNDYLKDGYFDEYGLRRWVFAEGARKVANQLTAANMKSTSLRRFYNRLKAIDEFFQRQKDFGVVRPKLYAFQIMAEDAQAREVVPSEFVQFVRQNVVLAVKDEKQFKGFLEYLQSVVAYARNEQKRINPANISFDALPNGYLHNGYYDEQRHLRREIFIEYPQELIQIFAAARPRVTTSALRRFYNKVKAVEGKMQRGSSYESVLQDLYSLERDAAYSVGREIMPPVFQAFIVKNVDLATQNVDNFHGFVEHFQAVIALGRAKLEKEVLR